MPFKKMLATRSDSIGIHAVIGFIGTFVAGGPMWSGRFVIGVAIGVGAGVGPGVTSTNEASGTGVGSGGVGPMRIGFGRPHAKTIVAAPALATSSGLAFLRFTRGL